MRRTYCISDWVRSGEQSMSEMESTLTEEAELARDHTKTSKDPNRKNTYPNLTGASRRPQSMRPNLQTKTDSAPLMSTAQALPRGPPGHGWEPRGVCRYQPSCIKQGRYSARAGTEGRVVKRSAGSYFFQDSQKFDVIWYGDKSGRRYMYSARPPPTDGAPLPIILRTLMGPGPLLQLNPRFCLSPNIRPVRDIPP